MKDNQLKDKSYQFAIRIVNRSRPILIKPGSRMILRKSVNNQDRSVTYKFRKQED